MDVDLTEIQKRLKNLLSEFHRICEENGLVYNLYGGTWLGAVRHDDIIPWDDDVDVSMPRRDYEKFIEIIRSKYADEFDLYAYPDKNCAYAFAKLGDRETVLIEKLCVKKHSKGSLSIDIFPMDGYPASKAEEKAHFDRLRRLKYCRCRAVLRTSSNAWWKWPYALWKTMRALPYKLRGARYYVEKEIEESKKYPFEDCEYVSCAVSWHEKGKVLKKDYFDRVLYKLGENSYWGMRNYDKYLTALYGDYMALPPEEARVSAHYNQITIK